jgi:hypothetical protein
MFFSQVIGKDLFRVVWEKWGANLDSFISERAIVVPGDDCYFLFRSYRFSTNKGYTSS